MHPIFDVVHSTTYRYSRPVSFGPHRVMYRPRASHDIRVLASDLKVSPHAKQYLVQDVFSNSVALVQPLEAATELRIVCSFTIEHAGSFNLELPMDAQAISYPFSYAASDRLDLEHYLRPHYADPDGVVQNWARQFVRPSLATDGSGAIVMPNSRQILVDMTHHIKNGLRYASRDEEGTQTPAQTLVLGSGSCRDYALLMMEAARRLGYACRFVSGYLYDPALDRVAAEGEAVVGAGATHAWVQVYLPGPGWVAFDPTNAFFGGTNLIRVATARDPSQASPISGSWDGEPGDYLGMEVEVMVRRR
ncbi:transglutaminase family protein [Variovorax sp. HJSM1_2]|uniref:transglutaminase family protein n=1 Tax=Variovorax sp. HJSM1_2 TaxID=3366263 RepID=UPI003BEACC52